MPGFLYFFHNFNWNALVLKKKKKKKKIAKTYKNYNFMVQLVQKWGPFEECPKQKTIFSSEIKSDHKLSKTSCFIKISYVLAELCMLFYFV